MTIWNSCATSAPTATGSACSASASASASLMASPWHSDSVIQAKNGSNTSGLTTGMAILVSFPLRNARASCPIEGDGSLLRQSCTIRHSTDVMEVLSSDNFQKKTKHARVLMALSSTTQHGLIIFAWYRIVCYKERQHLQLRAATKQYKSNLILSKTWTNASPGRILCHACSCLCNLCFSFLAAVATLHIANNCHCHCGMPVFKRKPELIRNKMKHLWNRVLRT